jgi:hypothetical protein
MEGVSKLAGAALVEAPFGWPHEKPQAVVALIKEARSHLQRGPATRLYLLLVGAEHQVSVCPPPLLHHMWSVVIVLTHHVVSGRVQEKELEEVLAGYYAAAMEVDDELEVVVLPPFALHNYDPRTDLRDIAVLLTLAPGTQQFSCPLVAFGYPPRAGLTHRVCQSLGRGPGGGERCAIEQRPAGSGL